MQCKKKETKKRKRKKEHWYWAIAFIKSTKTIDRANRELLFKISEELGCQPKPICIIEKNVL